MSVVWGWILHQIALYPREKQWNMNQLVEASRKDEDGEEDENNESALQELLSYTHPPRRLLHSMKSLIHASQYKSAWYGLDQRNWKYLKALHERKDSNNINHNNHKQKEQKKEGLLIVNVSICVWYDALNMYNSVTAFLPTPCSSRTFSFLVVSTKIFFDVISMIHAIKRCLSSVMWFYVHLIYCWFSFFGVYGILS